MRLQHTVNSPTQRRITRHKQGRDGGNNKALAHIAAPQTTTHHPFSFLSPIILLFFYPISPLLSFSLPSRHQSILPSLPPHHSCCLGNNTKRFFFAALSPWQRLAFLQAVVGSAPPSGPLQPACADHRRIEAIHWLEAAQAPGPPWALEEMQILQDGGSVVLKLLENLCFD